MEEFFNKYVKKYRKYFITSPTVSSTFLTTGAIIKELRNPRYKVYRYPGNKLPEKRTDLSLDEFLTATKIGDFLILSKNGDDIVATYPYQLLYIIAPDLYEKYKDAPVIDLEKVLKKNIKEGTVNEAETEKFFREHEEYIVNDVLYSESLMYYPLLADIIDNDEFDKYIVVYPEDPGEELDEKLVEKPPEERVKEASKRHATVLFIHKPTSTPLTMPIGTFMIIEPEKAIKIWKTFKKITPEEFIQILQDYMG